MKKTILISGALIFTLTVGLTSCKKEGCTDPTAINYDTAAQKDDGSCEFSNVPEPSTYIPSFNGEFGALIALKTVTTIETPIGNQEQNIGTAVAVFSENGGTSFVGAGTVSLDDNELNPQDNNSYVFTPSASSYTGINFPANLTWKGTGGVWPTFEVTTNQGFSTVGEITSNDPAGSSSYTLTSSGVVGADSTLFAVYGANGHVLKTVGGNVFSHTFTAGEMSSIGTGFGFVQVVGLRYDIKNDSGKTYYLINETARTKQVNID